MPVLAVLTTEIDEPALCVAQPGGVAQDCCEHRIQVERRLTQRLEDVAERRLVGDRGLGIIGRPAWHGGSLRRAFVASDARASADGQWADARRRLRPIRATCGPALRPPSP